MDLNFKKNQIRTRYIIIIDTCRKAMYVKGEVIGLFGYYDDKSLHGIP